MKRRDEDTIALKWVPDTPFAVKLNRTVPRARLLPQEFVEPFFPAEEETWRAAGSFLSRTTGW